MEEAIPVRGTGHHRLISATVFSTVSTPCLYRSPCMTPSPTPTHSMVHTETAIVNSDSFQKLKKGDTTLFAELVRDHHRALIALATPIVGRSEAEEVVQNAWLKAHQRIGQFEGRAQIRTWLSRIVINEAKMQLRQRSRELLFSDVRDSDDSGDTLAERFNHRGGWRLPPSKWEMDTPENLLMREDLADCLEELLDAMPRNQRALLELRDSAGLSFEEICNELSLSASNARVILHRARTMLFKLVDHYEETGEC